MLAEPNNRRLLEILRLVVHRHDSLAWAALLKMTSGIGDSFSEYIYERARNLRCQFGQALMAAYEENFPVAPIAAARRARELIESVLAWLDAHPVPEECEIGWGQWIVETTGDEVVPPPNGDLRELLIVLDGLAEPDVTLDRYLSQIAPLGKDRAANESEGVRIMNMAAAKGLTVRATIIGALEEGIIPRPHADLAEDRRLLYVAMTRAKEILYGTWARRRTGPTARTGTPRVIERRSHSHFLNSGPVESQDGDGYIQARWGRG
jgi:superfamily I DNA/RNA helicase